MYKEYIKRKEKVIINAIELLDEAGIQGLTTREIAKREGISEPAIYRQFDSKLDIIMAILESFSKFDEVIENTIIEQGMPPRQAVFYYVQAFADYYQSYPQITTVMFSFDVYKYEAHTNKKMKEIFQRRQEFVERLVKEGQMTGEFEQGIDSMMLTEIILDILWATTYKWKMGDTSKDLKKSIISKLQWIFVTIST